jgi:hypothetical protein
MDKYVLITKSKYANDEYRISALGDSREDLEHINRVYSDEENDFHEIYNINDHFYFNDTIESMIDSMKKYKFYNALSADVSIDPLDDIVSTHVLTLSEGSGEEEFNKLLVDVGNSVSECLSKNKLFKDRLANKEKTDSRIHVLVVSYGVDSWVPDSLGSYVTYYEEKNDRELFESFMDYISRHKMKGSVGDATEDNSESGSNRTQVTRMDYKVLGIDELQIEEYPIYRPMLNIKSLSDVVITYSKDPSNRIAKLSLRD